MFAVAITRLPADQSDRLLGVNADDANRNFDRGSLTTNRIGALGEMILRNDVATGTMQMHWFTPNGLADWGDGRAFISS